jgi:agmatine/peptidylarginine deiminase
MVARAVAGFIVLLLVLCLCAHPLFAQERDDPGAERRPSVPIEEIPAETEPSAADLQKRYDPAGEWKAYGKAGDRRYDGTITISRAEAPEGAEEKGYRVKGSITFADGEESRAIDYAATYDLNTRKLTTKAASDRGMSDVIGDLGTETPGASGEATAVFRAEYLMSKDGKVLVGSWSEGSDASGKDILSRIPEGLRCPAEFEPAAEVLLGCSDTYHAKELYKGILGGLAEEDVTVTAMVDSEAVAYELLAHFYSNNVDTGNLRFYIVAIWTIWMRDYGPLFAKDKSGKLYVVDMDYYPDRPVDDAIPRKFAKKRGYGYLHMELSLEGGNFMVDGRGTGYSTRALYERNSDLAESQVDDLMRVYLGCKEYVTREYILEEGTHHIDMFCKLVGADKAILGVDVSEEEDSTTRDRNNALMEEWKKILKARGYGILRAPYGRAGGGYYYWNQWTWSYVNSLLVNRVALIPSYGEGRDAEAVEAYKQAGYEKVRAIDCSEIIQLGGAIHCITMTVPK